MLPEFTFLDYPGIPLPSSAPRVTPPNKRKVLVYEDDDGNTWEEEEDEDVTDRPSFELNLDDQRMVRVRGRYQSY